MGLMREHPDMPGDESMRLYHVLCLTIYFEKKTCFVRVIVRDPVGITRTVFMKGTAGPMQYQRERDH